MLDAPSTRQHVIALFRLVIGLLFACQGSTYLFGWLGRSQLETGNWPYWYAAVIETVGGVLVMLGLGTRLAALLCSGAMAFAYFTEHQPEGLWPMTNGGELPVLYCWSFLVIAVFGPGSFALDSLFSRSTGRRAAPAGHAA